MPSKTSFCDRQSWKFGYEIDISSSTWLRSPSHISLSDSSYGSGLSNTALTTLNIALFAPIPSIRAIMATALSAGFLTSILSPKRQSLKMVSICVTPIRPAIRLATRQYMYVAIARKGCGYYQCLSGVLIGDPCGVQRDPCVFNAIDSRPLRGPEGPVRFQCYRQETPPGSRETRALSVSIDRRPLRGPEGFVPFRCYRQETHPGSGGTSAFSVL